MLADLILRMGMQNWNCSWQSVASHLTEDSQKFLVLILIQWIKQSLIQQEGIKGILETQQCLLVAYTIAGNISSSHKEKIVAQYLTCSTNNASSNIYNKKNNSTQ